MDNHLDLTLALQKLHELSQNDGDIGYEYWSKIASLLRSAPAMQQRIDELERQIADMRRRPRRGAEG